MSFLKQKTVVMVSRVILGLIMTVFGLNGFLGFMAMPELTGAAGAFMGGLAAAGYFFPVVKVLEIVIGVLLLANRFVPLALILLAPLSINFVFFHALLAPSGLGPGLVVMILNIHLAYVHCKAYSGVLKA